MSLTRAQLRAEAMQLDPAEREALAEELLLSVTPADRDALDAAWLDEVHRRHADAERTGDFGKPVDEVIARLLNQAAQ